MTVLNLLGLIIWLNKQYSEQCYNSYIIPGFNSKPPYHKKEIIMKKRVLLVISIIVILMGVMALIPGIKLGEEPAWHAAVKIVVGLVGLWVSLQKTGKTKTALLVIGILLAVMGLVDVLGLLKLGTEPVWHSIVKIVIGAVAIYLGATNLKED